MRGLFRTGIALYPYTFTLKVFFLDRVLTETIQLMTVYYSIIFDIADLIVVKFRKIAVNLILTNWLHICSYITHVL